MRHEPRKTLSKTAPIFWERTKAFCSLHSVSNMPSPKSLWHNGISVTAQTGDRCVIGSWVFGRSLKDSELVMGRIIELLYCIDPAENSTSALESVMTLDLFVFGEWPHPHLQCPVLLRPITDSQSVVLKATASVYVIFS